MVSDFRYIFALISVTSHLVWDGGCVCSRPMKSSVGGSFTLDLHSPFRLRIHEVRSLAVFILKHVKKNIAY